MHAEDRETNKDTKANHEESKNGIHVVTRANLLLGQMRWGAGRWGKRTWVESTLGGSILRNVHAGLVRITCRKQTVQAQKRLGCEEAVVRG
jgi:hypothetical protein